MSAPSLSRPCPASAVAAACEAMLGTIAVARALVCAGRRVDLAGLDGEISALCAAAITLPAADGQGLRPALEALLAAVDGFAATLHDTRPEPG